MTTPTYGPSPVPPEDIVAKIDEWVPRDEDAALLWRRTDVPSRLLIDARNEILRLRARVEVLEQVRKAAYLFVFDTTSERAADLITLLQESRAFARVVTPKETAP